MFQIRRLGQQNHLLASPFRPCVHALIPPQSGVFVETLERYAGLHEAYRIHLESTG